MLYRIYTENKNLGELEKLISQFFEGFTIIKAKGFWRLQKENSLIIEIEAGEELEKIKKLAEAIKKLNNQEAVLIQEIKNSCWLI